MMIKLDENLPASLAPALAALGHDVDTAVGEKLGGQDDPVVWAAAQVARRFLVTQELDFSDVKQFAPGTHAGILLLRLRSTGRTALSDRLVTLFRTELVEQWAKCFVVATETKIRIRRA
ncbi:MAG TPA: DUF5615 family PIN-like protein [Tepidisphaeraceae bacterium]|jgi:predicted nuclease of predicted toxin-antitoxin system